MSATDDLQALRARIDSVDEELIRLFEERMDISAAVARVKAAGGIAVLDEGRERQVLERAAALAKPENKAQIAAFMRTLMTLSKDRQRHLMLDGGCANLVFIGLPGSGKTELSRRVAEILNMPWYDNDQEIEAMEGRGIPEIFQGYGEEYFRGAETKCLTRLCAMKGAIIAAGGGAVLRNGPLLRESAFVVYLRRRVEEILRTLRAGTRPLLSDPTRLYALYYERHTLYEQWGDCVIENEGPMEAVAQKIVEELPWKFLSSTGQT